MRDISAVKTAHSNDMAHLSFGTTPPSVFTRDLISVITSDRPVVALNQLGTRVSVVHQWESGTSLRRGRIFIDQV